MNPFSPLSAFRNSFVRSVLLSILALSVGATVLAVSADRIIAAPTTCGGSVFHDFDHDGEIVEDLSLIHI